MDDKNIEDILEEERKKKKRCTNNVWDDIIKRNEKSIHTKFDDIIKRFEFIYHDKSVEKNEKPIGWHLGINYVRSRKDYLWLAKKEIKNGNYDKAKEYYSKSKLLISFESHLDSYSHQGLWEINKGNINKAYMCFYHAIEKNKGLCPTLFCNHYELGKIYVGREHIDLAIGQFEQATWCMPTDVNLYEGLGDLYLKKYKSDEARKNYESDEARKNYEIAAGLGSDKAKEKLKELEDE